MKRECNNDGLLVRYHLYSYKDEDYNYLGSYMTDKVENTIKYFTLAAQNEIEVGFNEYEDALKIDDRHKQMTYTVEDIYMSLPSQESLMTLEIYLK